MAYRFSIIQFLSEYFHVQKFIATICGKFHTSTFKANFFVINDWEFFCEIALRWISLDITDDKSTFVSGIVQCR